MRRRLSLLLLSLLAATLAPLGSAWAAAPSADDLLGRVPVRAMAVMVTEHGRLAAHPHYADILGFVASEQHAAGLVTRRSLGFAPGKAVTRAVGFRLPGGAEGSLLAGAGLAAAAVRSKAEAALGAAFATGEHAGRSWFSVASKLHAAELAPGVLVLGPAKLVEQALDLAAGEGRAVPRKSGYKALAKAARKGDPAAWGITWVPQADRDRLAEQGAADVAKIEQITWRVNGTADVTVDVVGYTASAEDAQVAAKAIQGKIERKLLSSTLLKAIGVAALARRIEVKAEGKTVTAHTELTAAQVGSLTRAAKTVMKVLR